MLDTAPLVEKMRTYYEEMEASGELPEGFTAAIEAARNTGS